MRPDRSEPAAAANSWKTDALKRGDEHGIHRTFHPLGRRLGVLVAAATALTALTLGIGAAAAAPAEPAGDTGRPPPGYVLERGRFTKINPPGAKSTQAQGINNRGQIAIIAPSPPPTDPPPMGRMA